LPASRCLRSPFLNCSSAMSAYDSPNAIEELREFKLLCCTDVLAVLQPIWLEVPETARRVRQRARQHATAHMGQRPKARAQRSNMALCNCASTRSSRSRCRPIAAPVE
jgi:hypothetical protein